MLDVSVSECLIALAAIGAAVAVIVKALKPWNDLREKVKEHDDMFKRDLERLDNNEQINHAVAKAVLQMTNHMIDGNHVDKLREARDNLQDVLIERS